MTTAQLEALDRNIKHSKNVVDAGNALKRLQANPDFIKIIKEGYFKDEAVRLVHLKSDDNMQSVDAQKFILTSMDSIGYLRQYFDLVLHKAEIASKAIASDEETREEMLQEELN